jgi:hypothetical protein
MHLHVKELLNYVAVRQLFNWNINNKVNGNPAAQPLVTLSVISGRKNVAAIPFVMATPPAGMICARIRRIQGRAFL